MPSLQKRTPVRARIDDDEPGAADVELLESHAGKKNDAILYVGYYFGSHGLNNIYKSILNCVEGRSLKNGVMHNCPCASFGSQSQTQSQLGGGGVEAMCHSMFDRLIDDV